jgi:hypothetical protein
MKLVITKTIGRWTFGFHYEKIRSLIGGVSCDFYCIVIPVWYFTFIVDKISADNIKTDFLDWYSSNKKLDNENQTG